MKWKEIDLNSSHDSGGNWKKKILVDYLTECLAVQIERGPRDLEADSSDHHFQGLDLKLWRSRHFRCPKHNFSGGSQRCTHSHVRGGERRWTPWMRTDAAEARWATTKVRRTRSQTWDSRQANEPTMDEWMDGEIGKMDGLWISVWQFQDRRHPLSLFPSLLKALFLFDSAQLGRLLWCHNYLISIVWNSFWTRFGWNSLEPTMFRVRWTGTFSFPTSSHECIVQEEATTIIAWYTGIARFSVILTKLILGDPPLLHLFLLPRLLMGNNTNYAWVNTGQ